MESTALNELIMEVRRSAAALAEAEEKVAAFRDELSQHKHEPQPASAPQSATRPNAKRASGWLPAADVASG